MKLKKIAKKDINELLKKSIQDWETYIPVKNDGGDTLFTVLPKDKDKLKTVLDKINLNNEWTIISPKDILFPQMETMFSFDKDGIKQEVNTSKKLIFGVKPCETKGILFVDEFYKRNFEDVYYLSRAQDRLIVTIGCITPPRPDSCFCASVKTGPFIENGYDLQLVEQDDLYFVEIGSDKGQNFVNAYSDFFKEINDDELEKINTIKSKAIQSINVKVNFDKALEIMKSDNNFEETYKRIGERCIYCGACLYVCPTCTCFNVFDDKKDDKGVRRRIWDACVFEGYTREASQHNPRNEKWLRTARRYEHKLKYDYQVTGTSGCIGCGRCLSSCPVNIGISKFIEEITEGRRRM